MKGVHMQNITENLRKTNITVSLHEKNNIYQAVINYKDDNNRRKQKWVSTGIKVVRGNKRQALQKAEEYREQFVKSFNIQEHIKTQNDEQERKYMLFREKLHIIDSHKFYDENILYFDYLKLWIEKVKNNLEPTTYTSHLQMINSRIKDYFTLNPIKLLELTPLHIQNFYDILLADGLKPTTVIRYHAIIRKSLDYAFKNDLIVNNPADKVKRPKKNIFVGSFYSKNELSTLFEKSKNDPLHLIILLTAFYGLRRSEVLGLKWSAIDFVNKTITIKHTVVEVKINGKNKILGKDRTKTKSSHRTLPLTDEIIIALENAKKQQKYYKRKFKKNYNTKYEEYVCLNPNGSLIKPDYVTRHFPLLLKNSGLRHIRFHDLRHSCASLLLSKNIPMKAIQEWLGHSDFSTTANIYAHLDINSKLLSAEAISSAFSINN